VDVSSQSEIVTNGIYAPLLADFS